MFDNMHKYILRDIGGEKKTRLNATIKKNSPSLYSLNTQSSLTRSESPLEMKF